MVVMLSTKILDLYGPELLAVARQSIEYGLVQGQPLSVNVSNYAEELGKDGACFVTLKKHQELRGCRGSLEAHQPLICEVSEIAFASAFGDTRFNPICADEMPHLHIAISLLTPKVPIQFSSEQELLDAMNPGEDGIVIEAGICRSTFLPSVWEQVPNRRQFLNHLKEKAGLPADYWSDSIKAFRYQTLSVEEQ